MNYLLGDFIIRIKNASRARRREVVIPYSKLNKAVGELLVEEKFLKDISEEEQNGKKMLKATVQYEKRIPTLTDAVIVSKPSLRVYTKKTEGKNEKKIRGLVIEVVSTSKGVMTSKQAQKKGLGGEVLFRIW